MDEHSKRVVHYIPFIAIPYDWTIKYIPTVIWILLIVAGVCFTLAFTAKRIEIESNRRIMDKLQEFSINKVHSGNLSRKLFHEVQNTFHRFHNNYLQHYHTQSCRRRYKSSLYDRKITLIGDSTARPIAEAMTSSLGCDIVQSEASPDDWMPDRNYFSVGEKIPDVVVKKRKCHKCTGFTAYCRKYNLHLEYWSMFVIGDPSVHSINSTGSFLHFLFEKWWNLTGQPDVIFDMASTTHAIVTYPKEVYQKVADQYFKEIFECVMRKNITYFWSTSPKVWEPLVPDPWRNVTSNRNIQIYNEITNSSFHDILNRVNESKKWMYFGLDLFQMSSTLTRADYLDAVHHIKLWNYRVGFKLLKLYCHRWSLRGDL